MTSTAAQIISDADICHANTIRITVNDEDCRTPIEAVIGQTLVSIPTGTPKWGGIGGSRIPP